MFTQDAVQAPSGIQQGNAPRARLTSCTGDPARVDGLSWSLRHSPRRLRRPAPRRRRAPRRRGTPGTAPSVRGHRAHLAPLQHAGEPDDLAAARLHLLLQPQLLHAAVPPGELDEVDETAAAAYHEEQPPAL